MQDLNAMSIAQLQGYIDDQEGHILELHATMRKAADNPTDPDKALAALGAKAAAAATRSAVESAKLILQNKQAEESQQKQHADNLRAQARALQKKLENFGHLQPRLTAFCAEFLELWKELPPGSQTCNSLQAAYTLFQAVLSDIGIWRHGLDGTLRALAKLEATLE